MRTATYTETVFDIGDEVEFVNGLSPTMIVLDVCDDCGEVSCGWFDLDANEVWHFDAIKVPAEVLKPVEVN